MAVLLAPLLSLSAYYAVKGYLSGFFPVAAAALQVALVWGQMFVLGRAETVAEAIERRLAEAW